MTITVNSVTDSENDAVGAENEVIDLISRQDAINAIENTDAEITAEEWDELTNAIKALPSADRPTGEWTDNHNGTFTCDQCGCKHSKSNYCPNCGARMYKGGEEE